MDYSAFTTKYDGIARELRNEVLISSGYVAEGYNPAVVSWNGLWDTGASSSCIHRRVRDYMHLIPIGTETISTANGKVEVDSHIIDVILPNRVIVKDLMVTSAEIGDDVDILLGMDIIDLGAFSITNYKGKTHQSLIIPSHKHIDYTQIAKTLNQVNKGHRKKR